MKLFGNTSVCRPGNVTAIVLTSLLVIGGAPAMAQVDPTAAFELEGDIEDSATFPLLDDWENLNCSAIGGGSASVFTGAIYDPAPMSIFTQGGSKDRNDIDRWRHTNGNVPDKDEILNAYAAQYQVGDEVLLYVGGDRYAVNGSAFIGAWFFQNAVGLNPDGTFDGLHKDGDILILVEFTNGGAQATAKVFEWVGTDPSVCPAGKLDGAGTLCDITPPSFPVVNIGFSNAEPQVIPAACTADWSYTPKSGSPGTIPVNGFFEAGINFSALGLGNTCFATFLLETRSSQEVDAQLKDFVIHQFAPCGVVCDKTVAPETVCEGTSVTYTNSVDNIDGGAQLDIVVEDDNGTPGNTADDFFICFPENADGSCRTQATSCTSNLPAGGMLSCTRTVTPTAGVTTNTQTVTVVSPPGVEGCTDTATVTVYTNPVVSINTFACNAPATSFTLTATPTGGTPPYTYLWNTGATTSSISENVGGTYSVDVSDANGCTAEACRDVGYCAEGTCP
jgi:hypothetical protein